MGSVCHSSKRREERERERKRKREREREERREVSEPAREVGRRSDIGRNLFVVLAWSRGG